MDKFELHSLVIKFGGRVKLYQKYFCRISNAVRYALKSATSQYIQLLFALHKYGVCFVVNLSLAHASRIKV